MENKVLQVVIWNLYLSNQYFDEREKALTGKYMLPTYLNPPSNGDTYVTKPAYSLQGDSVNILRSDGSVLQWSQRTTFENQKLVYHKFAGLPAEEFMTEDGLRKLHLVTSCSLISGVPSAICIRAGEAITDETAWVLPVALIRSPDVIVQNAYLLVEE